MASTSGTTPVRRLASLVGIVLDEPDALISQGTAGEEVALGLESLAVPYDEMVARVDEALDRVGLAGLAGRDPWTLSGGRAAAARPGRGDRRPAEGPRPGRADVRARPAVA